jgi:hypothetical protein
MALLETYERWQPPVKIDFEGIVGKEEWEQYWAMCEGVIEEMRKCQEVADGLRVKVVAAVRGHGGAG